MTEDYYITLGQELGIRISKEHNCKVITEYKSSIEPAGPRKQLSVVINKNDSQAVFRGTEQSVCLVKQGIDEVLSK